MKLALPLTYVVVTASLAGCAGLRATVAGHGWKDYARCAAAYRANAELRDPTRTPEMSTSLKDVADEYEYTALLAHSQWDGSSEAAAVAAVRPFIAAQVPIFASQSRTKTEQFIEHCPQTVD